MGLEEVLAKELVKLGAENVVVLRRGVSFMADKALMYKANMCCRTALRILKPVYKFTAFDADEVYEKVKAFEWEQYLDNSKTFAIDSVVYSENFRHSKFLSYRVKDAIVDRFRERTGERPSVRLHKPNLKINVHVANTNVTISIDSSGEPLYKRGYRTDQTEAPINEVLAAGLLQLAGWDGSRDFIDPMCGSGTFLVEAGLIARNIAPGVFRDGFAFEEWADFDAELFHSIYNDDSQEREFEHTIYGSDILKDAINIATDNVKSAGLAKDVKLKVCPMEELPLPSKNALVVFNPPYGERLRPDDLGALYDRIGMKLKNDFIGMEVWVITEDNETTRKIGLAPSVHIPIDNGGIACEFKKYELFKGKREDYVREKAMNLTPGDEEKKEENLGYTFFKYDYEEPGSDNKKDDGVTVVNGRRTLGHREADGSRSARPRVDFYHTQKAGDQEDEYTFDTPEEREAYLERKQRHERFESRQKRQQDAERKPTFAHQRPNDGGYPHDRVSGGKSVQRTGSRSWSRDGYRPSEERGGSRGPQKPKHDFKNDNYKPVRKFDRRNNGQRTSDGE